jgi:type IV secretory pathway TrbL component
MMLVVTVMRVMSVLVLLLLLMLLLLLLHVIVLVFLLRGFVSGQHGVGDGLDAAVGVKVSVVEVEAEVAEAGKRPDSA